MISFLNKVLDLIFPKNCFSCGKSGNYLCEKCKIEKLRFVECQMCFYCKNPSKMGKTCHFCKKGKYLDGVFITFEFNSLLKNMIHKFKYKFASKIGKELSKIQNEYLSGNIKFEKNTTVISVPIHKKRLLWRGFNQSDILAKGFSESFNLEFSDKILKRIKNTQPQVELKREERLQNIKNAFEVEEREKLPENVILIDDVITTGATLEECAKVLKNSGVKEIWAIVLAGQF